MSGPLREYIRTQIDLIVRARPQIVDFCVECGQSYEISNGSRRGSSTAVCISCARPNRKQLQPALGT